MDIVVYRVVAEGLRVLLSDHKVDVDVCSGALSDAEEAIIVQLSLIVEKLDSHDTAIDGWRQLVQISLSNWNKLLGAS